MGTWVSRECHRPNLSWDRVCAWCRSRRYPTWTVYWTSREYVALRRLALRVANGRCTRLGCGEFATQIHHLRYAWAYREETLEDVQALCRRCHEAVHRADDTAQMDLFGLEASMCARMPAKVWVQIQIMTSTPPGRHLRDDAA